MSSMASARLNTMTRVLELKRVAGLIRVQSLFVKKSTVLLATMDVLVTA